MPNADEYAEMAATARVELAAATNEADRVRLRRACGAYMKLSRHGAEAAERAAVPAAPRIKPEKPSAAAAAKNAPRYFGGVD